MVRGLSLIVLCVWLLGAAAAAAEPARLALLIGNQSYAEKVGALKNPRDDVALVRASLEKLGFKVTVLTDADYRNMDVALERYVCELRGGHCPFYPGDEICANRASQT
ncbi:MAG: caspase family protein [Rhodomicrobium sp.]